MPYIPHTEDDTRAMLDSIGVSNIEDLFDEIPKHLRQGDFQNIPSGCNEMQMLQQAASLAKKNQNGICFIGAGAYEHHIPAVVWDIASRGEFLTAYTPYQAEASQGTLQLLYEFQSMIAELTGMDVANASMYDGATALAEAVLMAARIKRDQSIHKVLVPESLHPLYRKTLDTILTQQNIEIISLAMDKAIGVSDINNLNKFENQGITALIIAQPNFFGGLEPVDALSNWAHSHNILSIACVNPIALGLLKAPSEWGEHGVDIVCGEGQPLGAPMASGGPYFGFFSTRLKHVRQMPGRLVGRTVDLEGKEGFTLTLQAREQHIRRAKATSNICTNQGLLVTAACIHMSLLGPHGLQAVAAHSHHNTQKLIQALTNIPGVTRVFEHDVFHECLINLPESAAEIIQELAKHGILGGYAIAEHYPEYPNALLICATEMRTDEEIEQYATRLTELLCKRSKKNATTRPESCLS